MDEQLRKLENALQSPELKAEWDMCATVTCYVHPYLLGDASDALPPCYEWVLTDEPECSKKADETESLGEFRK
jgi:hypothetical protein